MFKLGFKKQRYSLGYAQRPKWPKRLLIIGVAVIAVALLSVVGVRQFYNLNLRPVSNSTEVREIVIEPGALVPEIAGLLSENGLIRSEEAFVWYVKAKNAGDQILAGTYRLQPSMSTPEIVSILTQGKVATDLVTILPGQRIDEIRESLINYGFDENAVDVALDPSTHTGHPALVDKPKNASLEGYLYPESFARDSSTNPEDIVRASLDQMNEVLTPDIRAAFSKRGLSIFRAVTLASIVEQEAFLDSDRKQIAQVFMTRLKLGMALESDPTANYGAIRDGQQPSLSYDSPYNTYEHDGLPPGPISNVTASSLKAVANPADTDWLYFVAGDDKKTYFSKTLDEHERLTEQHCTTLCGN